MLPTWESLRQISIEQVLESGSSMYSRLCKGRIVDEEGASGQVGQHWILLVDGLRRPFFISYSTTFTSEFSPGIELFEIRADVMVVSPEETAAWPAGLCKLSGLARSTILINDQL